MTMTYRRAALISMPGKLGDVRFAESCDNGVASGDQIFEALVRSCVGDGFGHSPRRAQLVH